jgi:hypothetical protein
VHGDEVRHEAARSKFEAVWIFTIAAMFLLIPHQTAPLLLHGRSASANALRGAVCTLESSNAREKKISKRSNRGRVLSVYFRNRPLELASRLGVATGTEGEPLRATIARDAARSSPSMSNTIIKRRRRQSRTPGPGRRPSRW